MFSPPSGPIGGQRGAISKALIFLLLVLCAIYFYQQRRKSADIATPKVAMKKLSPQPAAMTIEKNSLALGMTAPSGTTEVTLYQPIELNYKSKSEVLELRNMIIQKNAQLLSGPYTPSPDVFGQIVDGLPWIGMEGMRDGPGPRVTEGPDEEARFLMNPYLLVAANFRGYKTLNTQMDATDSANLERDYAPRNLEWHPRSAHAEVTYAAECVAKMVPRFDLIAYNARDLGLTYIYVPYAESTNLSNPPRRRQPMPTHNSFIKVAVAVFLAAATT